MSGLVYFISVIEFRISGNAKANLRRLFHTAKEMDDFFAETAVKKAGNAVKTAETRVKTTENAGKKKQGQRVKKAGTAGKKS